MTPEQQKEVNNALAEFELSMELQRQSRNSEKINPDTGDIYPERAQWYMDAYFAARDEYDQTIHKIIYGNRKHTCTVVGGNAVNNGKKCEEIIK